ncbi:MAG: UTP--glucose-1-phosphate uridylyltransferase [Ignavibacteriae bacterium]|nr:UTP--glucose-1-phosphate uridylyltransferase [Ignavibacteriota bacterium]
MNIKKALITSAGKDRQNLPLQKLIDRDGNEKSILNIFIEDILKAGIEEIGIVVRPGDEKAYSSVAGNFSNKLEFVKQKEPLGYGHAIYCAKDFIGNTPFLHLVGDHLNISRVNEGCAAKVVRIAKSEKCSVSAVQPTNESLLPYFGAIGGKRIQGKQGLYKIEKVIEKPTPTEAEQDLIVPGLRASNYLCFFGTHVLTSTVFSILENLLNKSKNLTSVTLSDALNELCKHEQYLAIEDNGWRYNLGEKYGYLTAQLALALNGVDRDVVLSNLLEILAMQKLGENNNR